MINKKRLDLKLFIIITTTMVLCVGHFSLTIEIYQLYQNLLYIPVLLSCIWYGKKGFICSIIITVAHFLVFIKHNPEPIYEELVRLFVFIIIGYISFKLTDNLKTYEMKIQNLNKKLYEEKEKLGITISSIGDGVISTDIDGRVTILNKKAEELTGWTQEEAIGKPIEDIFNIIKEETRVKCENPIHKVTESGKYLELAKNTVLISKNGIERLIEDNVSPIKDNNGVTKGAILVFRDVTEEKQQLKEIYYMSYHDPLTGLYNRRFFQEEIKRIDTERNLPISVIMGDLNGLKVTNDAFGHNAGDNFIKKAAEAIKTACREDDVVARWGGDEFIILLPKTNRDEASAIVQRIKSICSSMNSDSINVSISFGYYTKDEKYQDIFKALKYAEDYMYKYKTIESKSMRGNIINSILDLYYENNPSEELHSKNVSELCRRIGKEMYLSDIELEELEVIGLLHDIGKVSIDNNILLKTEPLTKEDWIELKKHPGVGYRILGCSQDLSELAQCVLYHHEWYNGKGYPKGLRGEEIPLLSRIITIAEAYDEMTSERAYKKAKNKDLVINEFVKNKGIQFDPNIVDVFIENVLNNVYSLI